MIQLQGAYNKAHIHTNIIDETSISQIYTLINTKIYEGSKVHIMPDVHAGAGCVIGTTMTINEYITPNLVGVDLSCGVLTVEIPDYIVDDLDKLDKIIRNAIPMGFNVNDKWRATSNDEVLSINDLKAKSLIKNKDYYLQSLGTLGGGNHYIEIGRGLISNKLYLSIHSGSRKFGFDIASYYQKLAENTNYNLDMVNFLKEQNRHQEIQQYLEDYKVPKSLAYLSGKEKEDYLHDSSIANTYATCNRFEIARKILAQFHLTLFTLEFYETVHNYISEDNILRKGAISAHKDEIIFIPLNMRDGVIKAKGKGNPDWNYSAPHGAGRVMSRSQAKEELTLKDFQDTMVDVYSNSIKQGTIDEAPMAYKKMEDITKYLEETAEIIEIIKPVYNCKA